MNLLQLLILHAEAHNLVHMILAALAVVALHCPLRLPVCVAELSLSQNAEDDELTEATESLSGEAADTAATAAIYSGPAAIRSDRVASKYSGPAAR